MGIFNSYVSLPEGITFSFQKPTPCAGEAKVPPIGVVTCRSSPRGHMIVASARDPMVMGKAGV
jgi:hypothetical protein